MIDFMLDAGRVNPLGILLVHLAVEVGKAHAHPRRPFDLLVEFGNRQTALLVDRGFLRRGQDFRVDENPRPRVNLAVLFLFREIHGDQPHRLPDLDCRKTNAWSGVHGLEHIVGEPANFGRHLLDGPGDEPQLLVGQDDDFTDGHGGRFKAATNWGQWKRELIKAMLSMNFSAALTIKIYSLLTLHVLSSFVLFAANRLERGHESGSC